MLDTSISAAPPGPLLRVKDVTKSFGGVHALRGVDLEVLPGEVHGLLGENGAGKSTLIKILSGVHAHDRGSIEIAGQAVAFGTPAQSREAGVAVVYQDLSLVESLSVAANLMLGRELYNALGFLKKRQLMQVAERFLKQHGMPLDPRAVVGTLPFAYRQMTEICKALLGDVRLLILDEPTSALTEEEEQILFDAIRSVTSRGVGVIYVTHRLSEVFRICNNVTVFRDGANAGNFVVAETDMKQLVAAIVGRGSSEARALEEIVEEPSATAPRPVHTATASDTRPALLKLSGVSNDRLAALDLAVAGGEIRGLAGLIGSGRTEILETIFGLRPVAEGTVELGEVNGSPARAIRNGVALVPEDRHLQGVILDHSIARNLPLPWLSRFSRFGWFRAKAAAGQGRGDVVGLQPCRTGSRRMHSDIAKQRRAAWQGTSSASGRSRPFTSRTSRRANGPSRSDPARVG